MKDACKERESSCPRSPSRASWKESASPRGRGCKRLANTVRVTGDFCAQIPPQRRVPCRGPDPGSLGHLIKQDGTPVGERRGHDFSPQVWLVDSYMYILSYSKIFRCECTLMCSGSLLPWTDEPLGPGGGEGGVRWGGDLPAQQELAYTGAGAPRSPAGCLFCFLLFLKHCV